MDPLQFRNLNVVHVEHMSRAHDVPILIKSASNATADYKDRRRYLELIALSQLGNFELGSRLDGKCRAGELVSSWKEI